MMNTYPLPYSLTISSLTCHSRSHLVSYNQFTALMNHIQHLKSELCITRTEMTTTQLKSLT